MKIEILEIDPTDIVMISHNVEHIPPSDVDAYCNEIMPKLKEAFHSVTIVLLPIRNGETWEFTIIKQRS